jgi:hypothetical protein
LILFGKFSLHVVAPEVRVKTAAARNHNAPPIGQEFKPMPLILKDVRSQEKLTL